MPPPTALPPAAIPPRRRRLAVLALLALGAGCAPLPPGPDAARAIAPEFVRRAGAGGPPGAAPGTCWGAIVEPAVIETVTEQFPEPATADTPAGFRTETHQRMIRDRTEHWFRTLCPEEVTAELVASLQRALAARGLYAGPVSGVQDAATLAAIRAYQAGLGLDSALLSLDAARRLGLAAYGVAG